jgi:hypothetical protein
MADLRALDHDEGADQIRHQQPEPIKASADPAPSELVPGIQQRIAEVRASGGAAGVVAEIKRLLGGTRGNAQAAVRIVMQSLTPEEKELLEGKKPGEKEQKGADAPGAQPKDAAAKTDGKGPEGGKQPGGPGGDQKGKEPKNPEGKDGEGKDNKEPDGKDPKGGDQEGDGEGKDGEGRDSKAPKGGGGKKGKDGKDKNEGKDNKGKGGGKDNKGKEGDGKTEAEPKAEAPPPAKAKELPASSDKTGRALIEEELAYHEQWSTMKNASGRQRALHMLGTLANAKDVGNIAQQTGIQVLGDQGAGFLARKLPVPGVANVIGAGFAAYWIFGGGLSDAMNKVGDMGKGTGLDLAANIIAGIGAILESAGNIANFLSGCFYVLAGVGFLLSLVCPPVASAVPVLLNLGRLAGGFGTAVIALANILSPIPPILRLVHALTSNDDPINLIESEKKFNDEAKGAIANYAAGSINNRINTGRQAKITGGKKSWNPLADFTGDVSGGFKDAGDAIKDLRAGSPGAKQKLADIKNKEPYEAPGKARDERLKSEGEAKTKEEASTAKKSEADQKVKEADQKVADAAKAEQAAKEAEAKVQEAKAVAEKARQEVQKAHEEAQQKQQEANQKNSEAGDKTGEANKLREKTKGKGKGKGKRKGRQSAGRDRADKLEQQAAELRQQAEEILAQAREAEQQAKSALNKAEQSLAKAEQSLAEAQQKAEEASEASEQLKQDAAAARAEAEKARTEAEEAKKKAEEAQKAAERAVEAEEEHRMQSGTHDGRGNVGDTANSDVNTFQSQQDEAGGKPQQQSIQALRNRLQGDEELKIERDKNNHVVLPPPPGSLQEIDQMDQQIHTLEEKLEQQQQETRDVGQVKQDATSQSAALKQMEQMTSGAKGKVGSRQTEHKRVEQENQKADAQLQQGTAKSESSSGQIVSAVQPLVGPTHIVDGIIGSLPKNPFFDVGAAQRNVHDFRVKLDELAGGPDKNAKGPMQDGKAKIQQRNQKVDQARQTNTETKAQVDKLQQTVKKDAATTQGVKNEATAAEAQSKNQEQTLSQQIEAQKSKKQQAWASLLGWAANHRSIRAQASGDDKL